MLFYKEISSIKKYDIVDFMGNLWSKTHFIQVFESRNSSLGIMP